MLNFLIRCLSWGMLLVLMSCASLPPKNTDNLCAIFLEQEDWYPDAQQSAQRWHIPLPVLMAIMHQESHFIADAQPARQWLLGFIPWFRPSSAYGYAQALDETWDNYLASAGRWGADRDDFADAVDFIGWYCALSQRYLGIAATDTKNLYLAYHEGRRGYQQKSYLKKPNLLAVANQVARRARQFQQHLQQCKIP